MVPLVVIVVLLEDFLTQRVYNSGANIRCSVQIIKRMYTTLLLAYTKFDLILAVFLCVLIIEEDMSRVSPF